MQTSFQAVSLSHRHAPVHLREIIALSDTDSNALLHTLRDTLPLTDLLILSTCNRTEIYYGAAQDYSNEIIKLLGIHKGIAQPADIVAHFQVITETDEAVRHLFRVALGLESMVIGDMQIINQVKRAYQQTADLQLAGPFLHRLMHTIFFANKRVVQETCFRDGAASVSYAAVELVTELLADFAQPRVLVVGVGEIGRDVCKNLAHTRLEHVRICNRTQSKAEALAAECGAEVVPFNDLWSAIAEADVIISSVASERPLVTPAQVAGLEILSFKYFIDLSVPRSVDPDVENVPGALVYNIDKIHQRASDAVARRREAIPAVETIMEVALADFDTWSSEMIVSPAIQKFKQALEQIRQEEMARYMKQMDPDACQAVEMVTRSMMQKIIKLPVMQLKAACQRGDADNLVEVLQDLFNLEKTSQQR